MRLFDLRRPETKTELFAAFDARLADDTQEAESVVAAILADVKARGDEAVLELTRRFDFPQASVLRVPDEVIDAAAERIARTELQGALELAAGRIRAFHEKQLRQSWMDFSRPGEALGQRILPLQRVGIYVPGGRAAYPSTVLMTALPARVAGVARIALATPPSQQAPWPPDATLAAARLAGVTEIWAMGGAQAIGALAYGTQSIRPVDKIVGPGNIYANIAKKQVFGTVGIEMLAGPSEVAVLFDETASLDDVALETICQIEHDPANRALLVTGSLELLDAARAAIERQLARLPRAEIVRASLAKSFGVAATSLDGAIEVINAFAPEHLHLLVPDPWAILGRIENAGAILLGSHSRAALGDYIIGPSHTLPTAGCARYASPLGVDDFLKRQSVLCLDADAARSLASAAATIATFEGLEGHARSAHGSHEPPRVDKSDADANAKSPA